MARVLLPSVAPMATATTSSPLTDPSKPVFLQPRVLHALKWVLLVFVVLAIAGATTRWATARKPKELVHYETTAVDRGPIVAKVTATGTVSALVTVLVGSQVSGRIDTLNADFGSKVHKGQTIATIEPSFFRAAVAQARANHATAWANVAKAHAQLANMDRQFARSAALLEAALLSQADFDAAEAALGVAWADVAASESVVDQTQASLSQAELNLKYTTIVSPIDGVVISRNVDVGQTVAAALQAPTLFTIAQDLTRMQVDTNVAEADIGKIRADMEVTFSVDAYPAHTFKGIVRQVRDNATTLQNVVTYDAVIDVDNAERLLKPGMTASVTFAYASREAALRVPNGALRFRPDPAILAAIGATPPPGVRPDQRIVWVLRGNSAAPVVVTTGITDGAFTELLGGDVFAGDRSVVEASAPANAKRGP